MVAVEKKDGSLRICIKPVDLNKTIMSVHTVEDGEAISETADNTEEGFLYIIQNNTREDEAFAKLSIEGQMCKKFQINTGAQLDKRQPQTDKLRWISYPICGNQSPDLPIQRWKDTVTCILHCQVQHTTPIVGLKTCKDLELIKLILNIQKEDRMTSAYSKLVNEYKDTFKGIGNLENKCKIHLKENAVPTVYPARKVPLAMKQKLKDELDRLEALNIIGNVSEPTDRVNTMVMVKKKDGSVHLCTDPVDLNNAIRRPHHPIPTFDDATEDLHGISTVSKLDVGSGYWILLLTKWSSFYTTFSTIFGRYRWKRYPFGLVSAQDEFQRQMDKIFKGLEGIRILINDILIYGKSQEEHNNRLCAVLKRAREKGVRFNWEKCTFGMEQVKYFGHIIISKEGIKPEPKKLDAIKKKCQVQQPRKNSKPFWACSTSYPDTSPVFHPETRPY
ncbi:hypothetical protein QYM36_016963 [Artemia franciscana]|uniref:Reverse transcriptase domain-containing protein n=1 Tax=Artemia franciscana TaxID=6661 RepID=A0AA88H9A5_ARTSF|nr:hypothetical protein QYM36_016963 [Artemia franciscana]